MTRPRKGKEAQTIEVTVPAAKKSIPLPLFTLNPVYSTRCYRLWSRFRIFTCSNIFSSTPLLKLLSALLVFIEVYNYYSRSEI